MMSDENTDSGGEYPPRSREEMAERTRAADERAQSEGALSQSEERYRTLFESIDEGFCTIEVLFDDAGEPYDYRFLETNPAFVRQTGIKNGVGRTMREIVPEHEGFWFESYGRIARTGEAMRFEHEATALKPPRYFDVYAFRIGVPAENRVAVLFKDISERKRAQDALRESEERFRLFVTAASEIVYRMSADWSEMLRLEGKSFLTDTRNPSLTWLEEYIPDGDRALVRATIAEAIRTKSTFELEHRVIQADGTVGWVSSRAIPFLDERGEIIEWFGAASDITKRKSVEERQAFLLKLSDELRPLSGPEEIRSAAMRLVGSHLSVNRAAYVDSAGKPDAMSVVSTYTHGVEPWVGTITLTDFGAALGEDFVNGKSVAISDVEADARFADSRDTYRALEIGAAVGVPLVKGGRVVAAMGVHNKAPRDWTPDEIRLIEAVAERTWAAVERARAEEALRESEARRHLALNAAKMGTFVWYPQEDRGEPDARMLELFGLHEEGTLNLAEALAKMIHPEDRDSYAQAVAGAIDPSGNGKLDEEIRVIHPDESLHWVAVTAQTFFEGAPPRAVRMYGTAADITERKRAEANLAFLVEISQDLVRMTRPEETLEILGSKIGAHFNVVRSMFVEILENEERAIVRDWHRPELSSIAGEISLSQFIAERYHRKSRAGETIVITNVHQSPLVDGRQIEDRFGITSFINIPIVRDGQWVFTMGIYDAVPREWTKDEIELLEELTARIWTRLERARVEEALRQSEARLRRMVNVPRVGVLTFDFAGTLLDVNDAFLDMVGYSREEFGARSFTWQDFTPPEYVEESLRQVENMRQIGLAGPYEKEYFRKDGSRVWLMFVAADLGDGTMIEYAVDISDRKRAEEALRESEARLAADLLGMRRLYDLHARLSNETDLHVALDEILAAACEFTNTDRGCIQLVSDDGERLEMFAWRGYADDSPFIENFRHEGSKVACDTTRKYGARLVIEDVEHFPPLAGTRDREVALAEDIRATQSTPMISRRGEMVGVLNNQFAEPHRPTDDELRLIDLLAWTAADFIARHRAELALQRAHDELEARVHERTLELAETNASLQEEVRERRTAEERVKHLLRQLVTVQEEERRRIARELHDTLGQQLAALHMCIEVIKTESEGQTALSEQVERTRGIFDQLNSDVDFLAWELRPAALDMLGLDAVLQTFVQEWSRQFNIGASYQGVGMDGPRLAPEIETNLYRILQEALQNVHKHAGATHVSVLLERHNGTVSLIVEDDGRGYDPDAEVKADSSKGMGVTNMRERAALVGGFVEIESVEGAGTTIFVRVPVIGPDARGGEA